jgi:hypothetical protein
MSKMSRALLEAMDRFVLEGAHNGHGGQRQWRGEETPQSRFAAASRS